MSETFMQSFFTQNRLSLRKLVTKFPIVVTANGVLQRNGDNPYPFKQDASFWYLTGITDPDVLLVIDESEQYLITPVRSEIHERFEGVIDPEDLRRKSGVENVYDIGDGWQRLRTTIRHKKHVSTLLAAPLYISHWSMYTNPARRRLLQRMKGLQAGLDITDIRSEMASLRQVKQDVELTAIQRSVDITVDTLQNILKYQNWSEYKYEYEVEADLTSGYRRSGAEGHAFSPIVAGGIRACTFHVGTNHNRLGQNELVVIDTGAEYNQYAADISRTVAFGSPTDRQRAVFDAVLDTQQFAINLLKPGITFREWDNQWRAYTGNKLIELGLITTADEASIARYYPHYSHFLGLDVHDVGDYSRAFEPGMVLTCEPGIYIPEESIGVRIEDDILITRDGCTVLSGKLTSKLSS